MRTSPLAAAASARVSQAEPGAPAVRPNRQENAKGGDAEKQAKNEAPPTGNGRPAPDTPQRGPDRQSRLVWLWVALAALISVAAGVGAFWYYYRRYLPRKELEPYWNALRAIRARNYEAALPALTGIESKLPSDLRENARFFIALCHFHLNEEVEAEHILSAIHRERPADENAAYLLAYIRVTRNLDLEAEPVLRSCVSMAKRISAIPAGSSAW